MQTLLQRLESVWRAHGTKKRDHRRIALRRAFLSEPFALEGRELLSMIGGLGSAHFEALSRHREALVARHEGRGHHGGTTTSSTTTTTTTTDGSTSTPTTSTTSSDGTTAAAQTLSTTNSPPNTNGPNSPPPGQGWMGGEQDNSAVQTAMQTLRTDVQAIMAKSQVTVAQMVGLQSDIQAINKAATSAPSQTTLQAFRKDLAAIQGTIPTAAQTTQLENDYTALVQSRGVTDTSLISKTIADAEAIFTASGVTSDDLAKVAADQQAIRAAFGSSNSGSSSSSSSSTPTTPPANDAGLGLGDIFQRLVGFGGGFAGMGGGDDAGGGGGFNPGGPMMGGGRMTGGGMMGGRMMVGMGMPMGGMGRHMGMGAPMMVGSPGGPAGASTSSSSGTSTTTTGS